MAADEDKPGDGGPEDATAARAAGERRARQRPPVTIDLTAEPASADAPQAAVDRAAEAAGPAEPPASEGATSFEPSRNDPPRASLHLGDESWRNASFAALGGGLVALVLMIVLQLIGIAPSPGRSAASDALTQAQSATAAATALANRVTALEQTSAAIAGIRTDIGKLGDRVSAIEAAEGAFATHADVDGVAGSVADLDKKLSGASAVASQKDLSALADRVGKLEVAVAAGGGQGADTGAVAALTSQLSDANAKLADLGNRIAAAEDKVSGLAATSPDAVAARAIAAAALRRAAADGAPFAGDVDLIASYGVDASDVAALRPLAASGVKTAADIAGEFSGVADAILAVTAASDPNRNFFQRLVGSLVSVQPAGPVAGSDPPAIVSRMRDDVAKGDLAAALGERDALPDAGKAASAAWAADARNRVDIDVLVGRIADALSPAKAAPAG